MERAANARFSWGVGMSANEPHNVEVRINRLMSGDNKMIRIPKYAKGPVLCCSIILCVACVHVNYARAQFVLGTPVNFGPVVNSEANENSPFLSRDGLTLYFHSNRLDGSGNADIWMAKRIHLNPSGTTPENFSEINTHVAEHTPFVSSDGLTFVYQGTPGPTASSDNSFSCRETSQRIRGGHPLSCPPPSTMVLRHCPHRSVGGRKNAALLFGSIERRRRHLGGNPTNTP